MYVDPKKLKDKDEELLQSTPTPDQLKKLYESEIIKMEFYPLHNQDFLTALKYAIEGKRITKAEWNNLDIYCIMENSMLCLHKNGVVHHWLISEGDTVGNDWIILFNDQ